MSPVNLYCDNVTEHFHFMNQTFISYTYQMIGFIMYLSRLLGCFVQYAGQKSK